MNQFVHTETSIINGQTTITTDSPAVIASWFFPHETDGDSAKRVALTAAIEGFVHRTIERQTRT